MQIRGPRAQKTISGRLQAAIGNHGHMSSQRVSGRLHAGYMILLGPLIRSRYRSLERPPQFSVIAIHTSSAHVSLSEAWRLALVGLDQDGDQQARLAEQRRTFVRLLGNAAAKSCKGSGDRGSDASF
jgi:hypothetical protein